MSCSISGLVTERIGAIDVTLARLQAQLLFLTPPVVAASPAYMLSKGAHDPHTHTRCEEQGMRGAEVRTTGVRTTDMRRTEVRTTEMR